MEKLVYVLWKKSELDAAEFSAALRGRVADRLRAAGIRHELRVLVADDAVEPFEHIRMTRFDPPVAGMVSFWLDVADDRAEHEAALDEICDRKAGYLVVESVPIVNTTHAAPLGERTDGVTQLACIEVPDFIDYDDWLAHWHGHHRRVAEETQSTYLYVRNVVVRALTDDAPGWAGIVEEGFPTAAMTDPTVWYAADGDQEKFQVNMARMLDSVEKFLDISRVETNPLSEYLLPVD